MQCPTCGSDTPGTLGKCSHCAAPIDVYSVGPVAPLSAPIADAPPAPGSADAFGDRTVMVPPPTPSWSASDPQPPTPHYSTPDFSTPDFSTPDYSTPEYSTPDFSAPGSSTPSQTAPEPPLGSSPVPPSVPTPPSVSPQLSEGGQPPGMSRPPLQLSVEPSEPTGQPPPAQQQPMQSPSMQSPGPGQPSEYGQPSGFGQPSEFGTPSGFEQTPGATPPSGFAQAPEATPPSGFAQPPLQLSVEPSEPAGQPPYGQYPSSDAYPPGADHPSPSLQSPSLQSPPVQPSGATPTPQGSPLPPVDPEDTAAWTFNPDEDDDEPEVPVPSVGFRSAEPPPNPFGLEEEPAPTESIVPESWFAQPRKPDAQDADATQAFGAPSPGMQSGMQSPGAAVPQQPQTMLDGGATQIAPGPGMPNAGVPGGPGAPMGTGGGFDQTRMDPGAPMGAPPMGQGMQMGPMGGPMGPGGPGDPAFGGPPPPQGGRPGGGTSKPLLAAVAALVTIAVGSVVFVVWPSGENSSASTKPTPSASPSNKQVAQKNAIPTETKQQAAVVNKLLNDSVATRRVLAGAIGRAGKCKTLPQAIRGFEQVAQARQNQLARTRDLQVDKLANGERLRATLAEALTASLQVDQVLLRWAQQNQRNCRGKPRPAAEKVPGRAAVERRATTAKQKFVVLWNPVAKKTGQPKRSWKHV